MSLPRAPLRLFTFYHPRASNSAPDFYIIQPLFTPCAFFLNRPAKRLRYILNPLS
ncbi:hypothetical protein Ctu_1p00910 (plasmid) [Cronobacter turicensis z3032]|uniref:Uncharacterized protein n=1 Tax=Cronobacter turicensis (strain DSM 18703 / CCUG 55852 / LMG 23827 / z3032) TaxID=693216 RepID=C9Y5I3_CROTZ|nr:hypothetical protein Ctu_1p00910 [Cronobacter turicensis z3032]